eukprot:CAMPEP_0184674312 /NCGR_PEP_ID=MMETSP0308-20130426/87169_1 /TAXON_ID=38269 /ORGANISM="Gloeochaete witrockiana, Strain SAG 46.84" /LENGTH=33 /DNA_ID= /DNA_START= /DNA_END= /DNA_ORIENTATION=
MTKASLIRIEDEKSQNDGGRVATGFPGSYSHKY